MRKTLIVLVLFATACDMAGQSRIEKNVIYGMYSGLALLMDVHYPDNPNGYGVLFVAGSGWRASLGFGATGLKEAQVSIWGPPLLRSGYTVFAINHRAAPRFQYPAALDDVQRAVRFVRHNSRQFGIDGNRLGGVGGSSGGHLIALVAMLGSHGTADDPDPVNREPATLQTIVLRAAPSDLRHATNSATVSSFISRGANDTSEVVNAYSAASPIVHVSASSPPVLLVHGDSDDTVPYRQSVMLEKALRNANVPVKLVRVEGGGHGPSFGSDAKPHRQLPEVLDEMVAWLDRYLKVPIEK